MANRVRKTYVQVTGALGEDLKDVQDSRILQGPDMSEIEAGRTGEIMESLKVMPEAGINPKGSRNT